MRKVKINENQLRKVIIEIAEENFETPSSDNPEQLFLSFVKAQLEGFAWFDVARNAFDEFDMYDKIEGAHFSYEKIKEYFKEKFINFLFVKVNENVEIKEIEKNFDLLDTLISEIESLYENKFSSIEGELFKYFDTLNQESKEEDEHMDYLWNNSYKW